MVVFEEQKGKRNGRDLNEEEGKNRMDGMRMIIFFYQKKVGEEKSEEVG